jgi:hypothetical protein
MRFSQTPTHARTRNTYTRNHACSQSNGKPVFAPILLVLAFLLPSAALAAEYVKYKDAKQPINERVQDLLRRMTLEEKIGQMSQIETASACIYLDSSFDTRL